MGGFLKHELSGWKAWEIIWLATACTIIAVLPIHQGDDVLGITVALTDVICVMLIGKSKMSCYLFGLVSTVLYAWIVFGTRYHGEVMLNACYYIPMQFMGWSVWKKHMDGKAEEAGKARLTVSGQMLLPVLSAVSIYSYGLVLKRLDGDLPFIDSMSTCLSVLAMLLNVRCLIEQWIVWIMVDVVTVFMWLTDYQKGGTDIATLLMWRIYLLSAMFVFVRWFRENGEHVNKV